MRVSMIMGINVCKLRNWGFQPWLPCTFQSHPLSCTNITGHYLLMMQFLQHCFCSLLIFFTFRSRPDMQLTSCKSLQIHLHWIWFEVKHNCDYYYMQYDHYLHINMNVHVLHVFMIIISILTWMYGLPLTSVNDSATSPVSITGASFVFT